MKCEFPVANTESAGKLVDLLTSKEYGLYAEKVITAKICFFIILDNKLSNDLQRLTMTLLNG